MKSLHLEDTDRREYDQLLQNIGFPTMSKRQEEIYDPFPTTFQWMIDPQSDAEAKETGFLDWLKTDGTVYWINGKPGSGKSTVG